MCRLLAALTFAFLAGAVSVGAAEPRPLAESMAARVLACTGCHGKEGRATPDGYFPRIAGKPAGYLYHQLVNFRDGRRDYPLMTHLLRHLTDEYLREIAVHFAGIDLPYPPPQPAAVAAPLLRRGEALVRRGDRARDVPACAHCHGANLMGVRPDVPGLLGLSREYLYGQLGFWKNGERRAHAPDCMGTIASRLTPEDIGAVSAWLAAQPVPPAAQPASGFTGALPLQCGSVSR